MSNLPYRKVATTVRELNLHPYAGWLLTTITMYINPFTNCLEMSLAELAEAASMSASSVNRHIKVLETHGLVSVLRRKKPNSDEALPNRYSLIGLCAVTVMSERQYPVMSQNDNGYGSETQKNLDSDSFNDDVVDDSISFLKYQKNNSASKSDGFDGSGEGLHGAADVPVEPERTSAVAQALVDIGVSVGMAKRFEHERERVYGWLAYVTRRAAQKDPVSNPAAYVVKMLQNGEVAPLDVPQQVVQREHPPAEKAYEPQEYLNDYEHYELRKTHCEDCGGVLSAVFNWRKEPVCVCVRDVDMSAYDPNAPFADARDPAMQALAEKYGVEQITWLEGNSMIDPTCVWLAAYHQIELQLDRASFETWLRDAKMLGMADGVFVIVVKNTYAKDMLQHRLYRIIQRVLSDIDGQTRHLQFVCVEAEVPKRQSVFS